MMKTTVLLCVLLLAGPVYAGEPWDKTDVALGAVAATLLVVDWGQTRYIAKHPCANAGGGTTCPDPYREVGWAKHFIGERPTSGQVDAYFATSMILGALTAHYLPSTYRKWLLGSVAVVELSVVNHNYRIGIKMKL
mgnify:CR=1 FL=1